VNLKSVNFVQSMFRNYYKRGDFLNHPVSMIDRREFGFASFEGQMLRHKSFKSMGELATFLRDLVPRDAYLSCAYYEDPEAEMEKKGWLGADLVFDIDADHIPTPCDKLHEEWVCGDCGFVGKGVTPETCPVCSSEKFDVSTWPCEVCLASARAETVKLLDMLMQDFGFSKDEVHVFFSGHRGYHVHVESEAVKTLDAVARKEIVDYVSSLGLDVLFDALHRKNRKGPLVSQGLRVGNLGWPKRLAREMHSFIIGAKEEDLRNVGLRSNVVEAILRNRDAILRSLLSNGTWGVVRGVGFQTWRKIAEQIVKLQSAKIDTVVTTDTHRLIRLADTLHGKTGFKKVEVPVSTVNDFDPFKGAIAFKGGIVAVEVYDAPEFRLGDEMFGPYKNQKVELPTAAAVLLVCRGRAEVVE